MEQHSTRKNTVPTILRLRRTGRISRRALEAALLYKIDSTPDGQAHRLQQVRERLSHPWRWIADAIVLDGKTCQQVRRELQADVHRVLPAIGDALEALADAYAAPTREGESP